MIYYLILGCYMDYTISPYVQFRSALKFIIKKDWDRKQKVLAMEAGISEGHLSDIVKNKKPASFKTQVALAKAAGFSYENFLALGRKIHMGDDLSFLDKKPEVSMPEKKYEPHGGWKPRLVGEDYKYAGKVLEILGSKTVYSAALKTNIDAFYNALISEKSLSNDIENLKQRITELEDKKNEDF